MSAVAHILLRRSVMVVYRVKKGDSLKSVAESFGINICDIVRENKLTDILPGMRVVIPVKKGAAYTVQPYDTMDIIAEKFKVSRDSLAEVNKCEKVFLGQIIYIP